MIMNRLKNLLALALSVLCLSASAQEATIRKNIAARVPQLQKIDEVSKTPMAGLYEVRVNGTDIFYTDAGSQLHHPGPVVRHSPATQPD